MRVAAVPAYRNRAVNPYTSLLYGAVENAGISVKEFGAATLLGFAPDVVQIHWPEWLFSAPTLARARMQARAFKMTITMLRARGSRIVWTAHNLDGHAGHQPLLERRMWNWFTTHIDGWIALSQSAVDPVLQRYPWLASVPHTVVEHGHYRGVYPNAISRDAARDHLGIPRDARVLGFIGNILPYKQVPLLAECFAQLAGDDLRLVIAGNAHSDQHDVISAVGDPRIIYHRGFVADAHLQHYHRAADRIVLPYREIQNSGSAILSLSFDVPVLVPNLGAMAELADIAGHDWVRTYDGPLTPGLLADVLAHSPVANRPDISQLDWPGLGQRTASFFREVMAYPPQRKRERRRDHARRRRS